MLFGQYSFSKGNKNLLLVKRLLFVGYNTHTEWVITLNNMQSPSKAKIPQAIRFGSLGPKTSDICKIVPILCNGL